MRDEHHLYVKMAERHCPEWFLQRGDGYPGTNRGWTLSCCKSCHSRGGQPDRHRPQQGANGAVPIRGILPGGVGNVPAGRSSKDGEGHVQWSPLGDDNNRGGGMGAGQLGWGWEGAGGQMEVYYASPLARRRHRRSVCSAARTPLQPGGWMARTRCLPVTRPAATPPPHSPATAAAMQE
jgi:hypothetical protein